MAELRTTVSDRLVTPPTTRVVSPPTMPRRVSGGGGAPRVRTQVVKTRMWQDWTTLGHASGGGEVVQDSGLWLDFAQTVAVRMTVYIAYVDASTTRLVLETTNSPDGPWTELTSGSELNAANTHILVLSSESSDESYPLRRYLRLKATGSAANWEICFKVKYEPLTAR